MNQPTSDPFAASSTTWVSPLEQLLNSPDSASPALQQQASGDPSTAVVATYGETIDPTVAPQVHTEFQDITVPLATTTTSDTTFVTASTVDGQVPAFNTLDEVFNTQQDLSIHDQAWATVSEHGSSATSLFPADDHSASISLDAGGSSDPFSIS